jgi:hypothetical protein
MAEQSASVQVPPEAGSFNTEHKVFIRENWNKPLLTFLTRKVSDRLIYLGLPSPKAEDILQWIEHIKSVIAFQCRDYGEKSDESQERQGIEDLNKLLAQLERESKIDNYVVFDGYLEEVVLRGYDNSPTRIDFELSDFITLYNLDFCNKITSPIEFVNSKGEKETAYKFNAINKLLQIQQSIDSTSKRFVLFLTVHCSYDGKELQDFIAYPPSVEISGYLEKYKALGGHERNARIVRLFMAYHIIQQFSVFGFTPKILPSLIYQGLGGNYLLHFTIFGILSNTGATGGATAFQTLTDVLNQKFISIDNKQFVNKTGDVETESDVEVDPVKLFVDSTTYKRMWVPKT